MSGSASFFSVLQIAPGPRIRTYGFSFCNAITLPPPFYFFACFRTQPTPAPPTRAHFPRNQSYPILLFCCRQIIRLPGHTERNPHPVRFIVPGRRLRDHGNTKAIRRRPQHRDAVQHESRPPGNTAQPNQRRWIRRRFWSRATRAQPPRCNFGYDRVAQSGKHFGHRRSRWIDQVMALAERAQHANLKPIFSTAISTVDVSTDPSRHHGSIVVNVAMPMSST